MHANSDTKKGYCDHVSATANDIFDFVLVQTCVVYVGILMW